MGRYIRILFAAWLALAIFACKQEPPPRRYPMHGEVIALNEQDRTATIKHDKIGDWMGAMTMEYPIKNPDDFKKLAVGKKFDATVFVSEGGYYVGEVKPAP